jgi:hypothetical protein
MGQSARNQARQMRAQGAQNEVLSEDLFARQCLDLARRAESMGRPILTAPVDRDLEVAVLDTDFEHALARAVGISWCLDQRDK